MSKAERNEALMKPARSSKLKQPTRQRKNPKYELDMERGYDEPAQVIQKEDEAPIGEENTPDQEPRQSEAIANIDHPSPTQGPSIETLEQQIEEKMRQLQEAKDRN